MRKKVLFSPVGYTDPIKYFHDGSLIHICRVYQPDVVYLYLSKEMIENHRKDNRYVHTLELLGQKLGKEFEIHIIEREDLVAVQQYDEFYLDFRQIIKEIRSKMNREDQLLLNMASGTPAMKSALLVLATLTEYHFTPIQVYTPKKAGNNEYDERKEYDVETNWELDEDNQEKFENRCYEVRCMNLLKMLKLDMLKKHLLSYDYQAALKLGEDLKEDLPVKTMNLLKAARQRVNLEWQGIEQYVSNFRNIFIPVQEGGKRKLFEYALALDIRLRKGEYADFLRAITPLAVDLQGTALKKLCKIKLEAYCKNTKSGLKWDMGKLAGTEILNILNKTYNPFKYGNVYSAHLNCLIQAKCTDQGVAKKLDELLKIEQTVRNITAHEIVSVTPEWIKNRSGKYPSEIMEIISYLCDHLEINLKADNWDSYDKMNHCIIEQIENNF